jgi:hypothetical protein
MSQTSLATLSKETKMGVFAILSFIFGICGVISATTFAVLYFRIRSLPPNPEKTVQPPPPPTENTSGKSPTIYTEILAFQNSLEQYLPYKDVLITPKDIKAIRDLYTLASSKCLELPDDNTCKQFIAISFPIRIKPVLEASIQRSFENYVKEPTSEAKEALSQLLEVDSSQVIGTRFIGETVENLVAKFNAPLELEKLSKQSLQTTVQDNTKNLNEKEIELNGLKDKNRKLEEEKENVLLENVDLEGKNKELEEKIIRLEGEIKTLKAALNEYLSRNSKITFRESIEKAATSLKEDSTVLSPQESCKKVYGEMCNVLQQYQPGGISRLVSPNNVDKLDDEELISTYQSCVVVFNKVPTLCNLYYEKILTVKSGSSQYKLAVLNFERLKYMKLETVDPIFCEIAFDIAVSPNFKPAETRKILENLMAGIYSKKFYDELSEKMETINTTNQTCRSFATDLTDSLSHDLKPHFETFLLELKPNYDKWSINHLKEVLHRSLKVSKQIRKYLEPQKEAVIKAISEIASTKFHKVPEKAHEIFPPSATPQE